MYVLLILIGLVFLGGLLLMNYFKKWDYFKQRDYNGIIISRGILRFFYCFMLDGEIIGDIFKYVFG